MRYALMFSEIRMLQKNLDNIRYFINDKYNQSRMFQEFHKKIVTKTAIIYKYNFFYNITIPGKNN